MLFWSFGSQESNALNGVQIGVETKKLWPFEDNRAKHQRKFRSQSPISQGVSHLRNTPLAHECHFTAAQPHFAAVKWAAKMAPGCENPIRLQKSHLAFRSPITTPCQILHVLRKWPFATKWFPSFQMAMKWSPSFQMATKWFSSFKMGCENVYIFSMSCEMVCENAPWLRNDLQDTKWPPDYKNDLQNRGRFAKTPCKA